MSLTENINQLFLPGGATELKIWDLAPKPLWGYPGIVRLREKCGLKKWCITFWVNMKIHGEISLYFRLIYHCGQEVGHFSVLCIQTKNTWLPTLSVEYCAFKLFGLIHTPHFLGWVNRTDNEIVQISIMLFWLNFVTWYALFMIWVIPNIDFSVQCVQTKTTWLPTLSVEHCAFKLFDLMHAPGLFGLGKKVR